MDQHELAKECLPELETLAQALLDHAVEAIFLLDARTGRVLQANRAAAELSGCSPTELPGKLVTDFVPQPQVERVQALLQEASSDGPLEVEDLSFHPRHGPSIPIEVRLSLLPGYRNRRVILATLRDVRRRWQVEQEAAQRAQQLATLNEITAAINADLDLQETLRAIATQLQKLVDFDRVSLALLEEDGQHFSFYALAPRTDLSQHEGKFIPRRGTSLSRVIEERRPMIVRDLTECLDSFPVDAEITSEGIRSHISLPLEAQGRILGAFNLCSRRVAAYSEDDLALLQEVANHLAIAVQNSRLFEIQSRRAQLYALIHQVSSTALGELSVDRLLQDIAQSIHRCFDYYDVAIFLIDQAAQELYVVAHAGAYERHMDQAYRQSLGVGILGHVARTGKTYLANDVEQDPLYLKAFPEESNTRSELSSPIRVGGEVRGVLDIQSPRSNAFDAPSVAAMEALCMQIAQALEKAELYQEVRLLLELSNKTLDLMPSSLVVLDEDLRIRRVNQQFAQTWQVLEDAVRGKHLWEVLTGLSGEAEKLQEAMQQARETGRPVELKEVLYCQADGTQRILDLRLVLMQAYDETDWLLVVHDVTARVKRVYEVTRLYELGVAMRQTLDLDRLLHAILTCVTAGSAPAFGFNRARLFLLNEEEGTFEERMWVGPGNQEEALEIWDRVGMKSLQELIHDSEWHPPVTPSPLRLPAGDSCAIARTIVHRRQAFPVHPTNGGAELSSQCPQQCLDCLNTAEEFVIVPLVANDKTIGLIVADNFINRRPITDEDVNLLSLFANQAGLAVANATVHQELEKAYHDLQDTQEQLIRSRELVTIGQMAAHVAHEIRNPLVSIGGFARRIAKCPEDTMETVENSRVIVEEVQRLENILKNVMDFTAPGKATLAPGQLRDVVQDVCSLVGEELTHRQIHLDLDLQDPLPLIWFDHQQIKQVLLNLVRNAIEAMGQGGTLGLYAWQKDERVLLEIRDTGSGIAESDRANIFNPFFTTKPGGTGLGLAVTRKIIREHQGEIYIDSEVDRGTTFTITLPVREAEG